MPYGLPVRGQFDWDDEINNSIDAVKSTADTASAVATAAQNAANSASATATSANNTANDAATAATNAASAASAAQITADTANSSANTALTNAATAQATADAAAIAASDATTAARVVDPDSETYEALADTLVVQPPLDSWPIYLYGNSYSILTAAFFTAGNHYSQRVAARLGGGAVTSYGVGGRRILDVLGTLLRGANPPGSSGAIPGGLWPGTSTRNGLVILESTVNDFGHYPTMVGTAIPAALPSANTKYRDSVKAMYRAALALMSSESRVEGPSHSATSGAWTDTGSVYSSNGAISFTTAAGAYREYSITPPQSGPLAGKVFLHGFSLDSSVGVMAQQTISVDGTLQTTRTPSAWEQYTGHTGATSNVAGDCVAITVPVDGAAHTIRVTHAGSAGQFMYLDAFTIPSTTPNPIAVMGAEHPMTGTPTWTAAQTAVYTQNEKTMTPDIKAIVAEFSNAFYVPSTLTSGALYSADGLHPNDRGQKQRENDLANAMTTAVKARLDNRAVALEPSGNFPIL